MRKIKILILIISHLFPSLLLCCESESLPDISNISSPIISQIKTMINEDKKLQTIPIIAISGCSAVGKTEFTKALQKAFETEGIRAFILMQDNFMNPLQTITDYILHPHLDHQKIYDVMNNIKDGKLHITKPKFDWKKRQVVYEEIDLTNTDIILFEGIYVLSGKESYNLLNYSNMRIFLQASEDDIIQWNWQRENSGKCGHTPRDREKFDKDIAWDMEDYHKNILPTKIHADFVIEKDQKHNYSLPTPKSKS